MARTCIVIVVETGEENLTADRVVEAGKAARRALDGWPAVIAYALPGEKLRSYTMSQLRPFLPRGDK